MQVTPEQSPRALMSAARTILICNGSFLGNVRVMMSAVHMVVWACYLPAEWTGTTPAEWIGRRQPADRSPLSADWIGLIKCRGSTSPVSGMDRRRRLIHNKCRGHVTRRPYVSLLPLAYITRSR
jgi:hypothetical protein